MSKINKLEAKISDLKSRLGTSEHLSAVYHTLSFGTNKLQRNTDRNTSEMYAEEARRFEKDIRDFEEELKAQKSLEAQELLENYEESFSQIVEDVGGNFSQATAIHSFLGNQLGIQVPEGVIEPDQFGTEFDLREVNDGVTNPAEKE